MEPMTNLEPSWPALESAPLVLPLTGDHPGVSERDLRLAALHEALHGVVLGAYDRAVLDRLADLETSAIATLVSLLYRTRELPASQSPG
jgi:hypothetical protein